MNKMTQQVARTGGGFPGGKGPRGGMIGMASAAAALLGAYYVGNNAIFNVEGGQRAIKYKRLTGVSKEIYSEGASGLADQPSVQLGGCR